MLGFIKLAVAAAVSNVAHGENGDGFDSDPLCVCVGSLQQLGFPPGDSEVNGWDLTRPAASGEQHTIVGVSTIRVRTHRWNALGINKG